MRRKRHTVALSLDQEHHEGLCRLAQAAMLSVDDYVLVLVDRHLRRKLRKLERTRTELGSAPLDALFAQVDTCEAPPQLPHRPAGRKKQQPIDFAEIRRRSRPTSAMDRFVVSG